MTKKQQTTARIEGIVAVLVAEYIKNEIMPKVIEQTMKELKKREPRR